MPRVGSVVSLYFGDDDERNGRAVNCIRVNAPKPDTLKSVDEKYVDTAAAAEIEDEIPEDPFMPGFRSLTTEHRNPRKLTLYPHTVGFSGGGMSMMLGMAKGIAINSNTEVRIEAKGKIEIEGKTAKVTGKNYGYICNGESYRESIEEIIKRVNDCNGMVMSGDGNPKLIVDPKSELYLRTSAIGGEITTGVGKLTVYETSEPFVPSSGFDPFNDDPKEQPFNLTKMVTNMAISGVIIVVIAGVAVVTYGAALPAMTVKGIVFGDAGDDFDE